MKYRQFRGLNWEASALGFGCMRLPTEGDDRSNIKETEAAEMLHHAIDRGLNYLDTAYPYHSGEDEDSGSSERFLGRALQGGYREKIRLATKLPCWLVESREDFDRYLNEQLEKLQTDHVDFYLLHGLRRERWDQMRDLNVFKWAEGALDDGRIGHLGFSFHDDFEMFKEIVDGYDWTFCQIQYNYMNTDHQAGTRGLRYAASKGLAVVIMEPLLGGMLVNPPEPIREIWDTAPGERSPVDWALQWLWDQPEVSVVLSGMSTMQQVKENIASAGASAVGTLSSEELAVFDEVREGYEELCPIPCTECEYCMPCPNGVNIPRNFSIYNDGRMYNKIDWARERYAGISEEDRASACIQCRECEEKCPQNIPISEWMPIVHEVLGEGRSYQECAAPQ